MSADQNVKPDNCYAVTDVSATGPNIESVAVRCVDCDVAFAAAR